MSGALMVTVRVRGAHAITAAFCLAGALAVAPATTIGAQSLTLHLYAHFDRGCEADVGYYYLGARPDTSTFELRPVELEADGTLAMLSHEEFALTDWDADRTGLTFVLAARDRQTILFEREFVFKTSPDEAMYGYSLSIHLSCAGGVLVDDPVRGALRLDVHFLKNCPATNGYWHVGEPSLDAVVEPTELWPAAWSGDDSIVANVLIPYQLVGGPPPSHPFTLVATDGETVLFQRHLDFVIPPDRYPQFHLTTWLDCSTTPYSEAAPPDTRMREASSSISTIAGATMLLAGVVMLRSLRRRRWSGDA